MFIFRAAGVVAQEAPGLQIGAHSGDQRSDHSDVTHGLVTNLSRGRVGDAFFKASSEKPQCRAGRADSAVVQTNRCDMGQGKTGFADEVGRWHFHVVEMDLGKTGRAKPHQIVDGFDCETGSIPGHQTGHRAFPQFSKYQKHPGKLGAAYPFLAAVQNEMVTFGREFGCQRLDVAPGARLRQAKAPIISPWPAAESISVFAPRCPT